ncbi:unnamed protein product [Boreogadus saida]
MVESSRTGIRQQSVCRCTSVVTYGKEGDFRVPGNTNQTSAVLPRDKNVLGNKCLCGCPTVMVNSRWANPENVSDFCLLCFITCYSISTVLLSRESTAGGGPFAFNQMLSCPQGLSWLQGVGRMRLFPEDLETRKDPPVVSRSFLNDDGDFAAGRVIGRVPLERTGGSNTMELMAIQRPSK